MTTIHIPPAALEAGARAICETENGPCECMPDECGCTYWKAHARAAFELLWKNSRDNVLRLVSCHPDYDSMHMPSALLIQNSTISFLDDPSQTWNALKNKLN